MGVVVELRQRPYSRSPRRATSAYLAVEPNSDPPATSCPVLAAFVHRPGDDLDDQRRQLLRPHLPAVARIARDGHARRRGWMCVDWLTRTHAASWIDYAGNTTGAAALRDLAEIRDVEALECAAQVLEAICAEDGTRWDAACAAAGDPAWDATWPAAWDAARAAAWDRAFCAAWDGGRTSFISAGRLPPHRILGAIRSAARDAAFTALSPSAFDVACRAASSTSGDYRSMYHAAASAAAPALEEASRESRRQLGEALEASALDLLTRMMTLGA
jgi:hypothetical protein